MITDACGFIETVTTCTELPIEDVLGKKDSPLQEVLYVLSFQQTRPRTRTYYLRSSRCVPCESHGIVKRGIIIVSLTSTHLTDSSRRTVFPYITIFIYSLSHTHTHTHTHANIHPTSWFVKGGAATSCSTRTCIAEVLLLDSKVKGVEGLRPR